MDLSDLKWVSKRNLQTFWDGIKGSLFGDLAFHEDNATSGHAYSAGDLLGHESHLYRATSSIAAGDTLESGVNMERTLVDAEIKRSRQSVNTEFDPRLSNILGDLATVEVEMVATQNYAVGDYIVIGDYFYRVTDAITSGDTLTVGTNIERTNVGAEMSELNSNEVKIVSGSTSYTVGANGLEVVSIGFPSIPGYTRVGAGGDVDHDYIQVTYDTAGKFNLWNHHTGQQSGTLYYWSIYKKT